MRRLFIQFYLILIACFLVAVFLIAVIYKQAVEDVEERYLSDLLRTTLTLIEADLQGVPESRWNETLASSNYDLTFHVKLEKISNYVLDPDSKAALDRGDIVMLADQYLFLQKMADSPYVLVAGPLDYLFFLHRLGAMEYILLGLVALLLAVPVFLWMRPHWRNLMTLEQAANRLSQGDFSARVVLPNRSGMKPLAASFNHMADSIVALLESKKNLINAVAHELRTPLARLRYRLALLDISSHPTEQQAIERDLGSIDMLIDELLLQARLGESKMVLSYSRFDALNWVVERIDEQKTLGVDLEWHYQVGEGLHIIADSYLITRALDNLLSNARRYAHHIILVSISLLNDEATLSVEDDGPGIPEQEWMRIFEPFVRMDESRGRQTGGYGLGLAIVSGVVRAHHGEVFLEASKLGGARFILRWPMPKDLSTDLL